MYKLSDNAIGQISKLLQLAILTGTDIIDNLRTLKLVADGNRLDLDPEYVKYFEQNLSQMTEFLKDAGVAPESDDTATEES